MDELDMLVDTNVALDVLLEREPLVRESKKIWQAVLDGRIRGYLTVASLLTIYYYTSQKLSAAKALEAVRVCLRTFVICPIDREALELALTLKGKIMKITCKLYVQ